MTRPPTIFLLSPADVKGVRGKQLASPRAMFAAAVAYRTPEGVPIADAFAFMSALYFRGKIAYARHFASAPPSLEGNGIYVITPGFGLVDPAWRLEAKKMRRLRRIPVDARSLAYRKPLQTHAREIAARIPSDTRVVLLGSIATGKYIDVLRPVFGERLHYPTAFVGVGDMSRGALMLRAVRDDRELDYTAQVARRA